MRQIDQLWLQLERLGCRPRAAEVRIIHYIHRMENAVTGACQAAVTTIAAATGYSESHTRACIIRLASLGAIEKTPRWDRLPNGLKPQLANALRLIRPDDEERRKAAERDRQRRAVYLARKEEARARRAEKREKALMRLVGELVAGVGDAAMSTLRFAVGHSGAGRGWAQRSSMLSRQLVLDGLKPDPRLAPPSRLGRPPIIGRSPEPSGDLSEAFEPPEKPV